MGRSGVGWWGGTGVTGLKERKKERKNFYIFNIYFSPQERRTAINPESKSRNSENESKIKKQNYLININNDIFPISYFQFLLPSK